MLDNKTRRTSLRPPPPPPNDRSTTAIEQVQGHRVQRTSRHRDVHESLYLAQTRSSSHRVSPQWKSSSRKSPFRAPSRANSSGIASTNVSTSALSRRSAALVSRNQEEVHGNERDLRGRSPQVHLGFRIVRDDSNFNFDEVDQCLRIRCDTATETTESTYPSDFVFSARSDNESIGNSLVPLMLADSMQGTPSTIIAVGEPESGKSTTLFGTDGLLRSHVAQLLVELDRRQMGSLWEVRIAVIEVAGEEVVNVLAPLEEGDSGLVAEGYHHAAAATDRPDISMDALHSHVIETQQDLDEVCRRICRGPRSPARHIVVAVSVTPTAGVKQMGDLVKPFGTVSFVELAANFKSVHAQQRKATIIQRGVISMVNALSAMIRRERSFHNVTHDPYGGPAPPVHVPFGDDALPALLHPYIEHGVTYVMLHLDGKSTTSKVENSRQSLLGSHTTLQVADRILAELYPSGPPPVDYRAVAHKMQRRVEELREELKEVRHTWSHEKASIQSDNTMLKKAFESAAARSESLMTTSTMHQPSVSAISNHGGDKSALLDELQRSRDELAILRSENAQLRLFQASTSTLNPPQQGGRDSSVVSLEDSTIPTAPPPEPTTSGTQAVELDSILRGLGDIVQLPAPGGNPDDSIHRSSMALVQLTHQLCERERAYESAVKRSMLFQRLDSSSPVEANEAAESAMHRQREQELREELKRAPIHGWQRWRRVLEGIQKSSEPTTVAAGNLPGARTRTPQNLYSLAHDSAKFNTYWNLVAFEDGGAPPPPTSGKGPEPGPLSPPSKLEQLLQQS